MTAAMERDKLTIGEAWDGSLVLVRNYANEDRYYHVMVSAASSDEKKADAAIREMKDVLDKPQHGINDIEIVGGRCSNLTLHGYTLWAKRSSDSLGMEHVYSLWAPRDNVTQRMLDWLSDYI